MKKLIIIFIILLAFYSCDEYVPYILDINNQSNDTIKIVFFEKSPYSIINPDSLYFLPKQKKMLWGTEGDPGINECNYTGIKKDEIEIHTSSGRKLKKGIWEIKNWECSGSYKAGWTMTFTVTNEDLE